MDTFFIFGAVYAIAIPVIVLLIWLSKAKKEERIRLICFALISLPITYLIGYIAGKIYPNPRPFISDGIIPLIAHSASNGFPSDHTLLAGAIAALLWPFSRRTSLWLWLVAIYIGLSRVYVGVHHTADIVGALIIATAVAWAVWKSGWVEKLVHKWHRWHGSHAA